MKSNDEYFADKWRESIGHTVLVKTKEDGAGPFEYKVLQLSPSGSNVQLQNRGERTFWCGVRDYVIVDVLK